MFCAPHFPNWKITVPFSMLYVSRKKTKTQKRKGNDKKPQKNWRHHPSSNHPYSHHQIAKEPQFKPQFILYYLFVRALFCCISLPYHTHTHNRTLCCITFTGTTIICPVIRSYYLTYYL